MEKEQQKKACMTLGGLLLFIGLCFLLWMIGTMVEFAEELETLKRQLQMYYPYSWEQVWNDPRVQEAISEGYMTLFTDKAVFFIPLILAGLIIIRIGKKVSAVVVKEGITEVISMPREREEALKAYAEIKE